MFRCPWLRLALPLLGALGCGQGAGGKSAGANTVGSEATLPSAATDEGGLTGVGDPLSPGAAEMSGSEAMPAELPLNPTEMSGATSVPGAGVTRFLSDACARSGELN